MEMFAVRYHLINNEILFDKYEAENFGEAVIKVGQRLQAPGIAIVKNEHHVIEIPTSSIVYHEVMTTEKYDRLKVMENASRFINEISPIANYNR